VHVGLSEMRWIGVAADVAGRAGLCVDAAAGIAGHVDK